MCKSRRQRSISDGESWPRTLTRFGREVHKVSTLHCIFVTKTSWETLEVTAWNVDVTELAFSSCSTNGFLTSANGLVLCRVSRPKVTAVAAASRLPDAATGQRNFDIGDCDFEREETIIESRGGNEVPKNEAVMSVVDHLGTLEMLLQL